MLQSLFPFLNSQLCGLRKTKKQKQKHKKKKTDPCSISFSLRSQFLVNMEVDPKFLEEFLDEFRSTLRTHMDQIDKRFDRFKNIFRGQPRKVPNIHRRASVSMSVQ